ncbi:MAG: DUF928 domain-containing protein [Coleofasciculus sp. S288]|nr:DUF928 domain-containing protein [Coleofasciculus sp. S288]
MARTPLSFWKTTLLYSLILAFVSVMISTPPGWTQDDLTSARSRRRGAAARPRRGLCPAAKLPLTALILAAQSNSLTAEQPLDVTVAEHPTFWFYVPYSPDARFSAEFVLIDENEQDVYKTTFSLKQKPGIIGLKIPEMLPPLQTGKRYQWVFSIVCDPNNRSGDATVNGEIERIPLNSTLQTQLESVSTPSERVSLYAQNGLWYEALTSLAQLRRNNLQNSTLQADWSSLLKSMNLNDIASEPLTSCCITD